MTTENQHSTPPATKKALSSPLLLATNLINEEGLRNSIKRLLPPETVTLEQFCAAFAQYLHKNETALSAATYVNLRECAFEGARYGFLMGGSFSPADIIIRSKKNPVPKFELSKHGLMELAFRSGLIKAMEGEVIYEGDTFKNNLADLKSPVYHERHLGCNPEKILGVYLLTLYTNGVIKAHIMGLPEMKAQQDEAKKKAGDGWNYSPWLKFLPEMCLKTLVKRACKRFPYAGGNKQVLDLLNKAIDSEYQDTDKKGPNDFVPPEEKQKKDALDFLDQPPSLEDNRIDQETGELTDTHVRQLEGSELSG